MQIIGIGNALVDMLIRMPDDQLIKDLKLLKGSMQLVDKAFINTVVEKTQSLPKSEACGGSAANTIYGIASLGAPAGFIGSVGRDRFGDIFKLDLQKNKITPFLTLSQSETGIAGTLISPDSERTFTTFLGAAGEISKEQIEADIINQYQLFHIEGYLVFNQELIAYAASKAKESGLRISIDLASFNVVEANLAFLRDMVKKYVDIVFANEEEARSFTGKEPLDALHEIAEMAEIAIVKIGKNGSLVKTGTDIFEIPPIVASPRDTTGAGDLYAGGFLYGYSKGLSLMKCGKIGSLLAGKVIEQIGAKIPEDIWQEIRLEVKKIESE